MNRDNARRNVRQRDVREEIDRLESKLNALSMEYQGKERADDIIKDELASCFLRFSNLERRSADVMLGVQKYNKLIQAATYCQLAINVAQDPVLAWVVNKDIMQYIVLAGIDPRKYMSFKPHLLAGREFYFSELNRIKLRYQNIMDVERDVYEYESMELLYRGMNNDLRDFFSSIISESKALLGNGPCSYSVIGLGSMALGQMTPYSDIEFAILLSKNITEEQKEYFYKLTYLVQFFIVNLGESLPRGKWVTYLSHSKNNLREALIRRGMCFDGGGKTPFGNPERGYVLIKAVDDMLEYVCYTSEKYDEYLPYMLDNVTHIYGEIDITDDYIKQVKSYLAKGANGVLNCEVKALIRLQDNFCYKSRTKDRAVSKAIFDAALGRKDGILHVKYEIYRPLERLLYGLELYRGIIPCDMWSSLVNIENMVINTVETGYGRNKLDIKSVINIAYSITLATRLRLETYFHYNAQYDMLAVKGEDIQARNRLLLYLEDSEVHENSRLFRYFGSMWPIYFVMEDLFETEYRSDAMLLILVLANANKDRNLIKSCIWKRFDECGLAERILNDIVPGNNRCHELMHRSEFSQLYSENNSITKSWSEEMLNRSNKQIRGR